MLETCTDLVFVTIDVQMLHSIFDISTLPITRISKYKTPPLFFGTYYASPPEYPISNQKPCIYRDRNNSTFEKSRCTGNYVKIPTSKNRQLIETAISQNFKNSFPLLITWLMKHFIRNS